MKAIRLIGVISCGSDKRHTLINNELNEFDELIILKSNSFNWCNYSHLLINS
jgi:hypothetical protein